MKTRNLLKLAGAIAAVATVGTRPPSRRPLGRH